MSIRCFWMISVSNKSLLANRTFVAIEARAKSAGLPALPVVKSPEHEAFLVRSILSALLVHSPQVATNETSFLSDIFVESLERSTIPALEITLEGSKLWPVIICEQAGLLFCALPLIECTPDKCLVDHLPVSVTFAFLQQVMAFLTNHSLADLDNLLASIVPLGRYIGVIPKAISNDRKQDEMIISISVQEKVSHSSDDEKDKIFGTVFIDLESSQAKLDQKANINLLIRNLSTMEIAMSPACFKATDDTVSINLSRRDTQTIHYWKPSHDFNKFIEYTYEIWNQTASSYRLQLTISLGEAYSLNKFRFSHFNVSWRESFKDQYKPCSINCTHGQMGTDVNKSLVWSLGSKLPRTSKAMFSCDITTTSGLGDALNALCLFEIKDWSMAVTLSRDCITVASGFPSPPKVVTSKSISSSGYTLKWTLVPNPSAR